MWHTSSIEKYPKRQSALYSVRRICKCHSSFVVHRYKKDDIAKIPFRSSNFPAKKESVQIKIIHSKSFFFIKIDFMSAEVPTFVLSTSYFGTLLFTNSELQSILCRVQQSRLEQTLAFS